MTINEINKSISFIQDGEECFQVLNEAGDDWDEVATAALYDEFRKKVDQ